MSFIYDPVISYFQISLVSITFQTQVCKYCGEDENYSLANNICYSCNSELQLRKNVVCKVFVDAHSSIPC